MENYLKGNDAYWQQGYEGENVESFVFRVYGRILKHELGLSGQNGERMLDFGCGDGAALAFFNRKGFDVYGVDISRSAIEGCRKRMPHLADHFEVIDPKPSPNDRFFHGGGGYDLVTGIQSLYLLNPQDLEVRLLSLKEQMKPGGVIYATMMGTKCWYYEHSRPCSNGMRVVDFKTSRQECHDYYVTFTESEEDLIRKFSMFKKRHVGYYDACYREDEGSDFHWTFIGQA